MKRKVFITIGSLYFAVILISCNKKDYFFSYKNNTQEEMVIRANCWYSIDDGKPWLLNKDSIGPYDIFKVTRISKSGAPYVDIVYYETNLKARPISFCDIDTALIISYDHFSLYHYAINPNQYIDVLEMCNH